MQIVAVAGVLIDDDARGGSKVVGSCIAGNVGTIAAGLVVTGAVVIESERVRSRAGIGDGDVGE